MQQPPTHSQQQQPFRSSPHAASTMRYESLNDENNSARPGINSLPPSRGVSPSGNSSMLRAAPSPANGSMMPLLLNSPTGSSTPVGRIRLSSAILGIVGVLTGAILMFLVIALRRHIDNGGGTHTINPHPGFAPIPLALESLERRGLWFSGRSLTPLNILRSRLDRAKALVQDQQTHWERANCSIGNAALDAFSGALRYSNSTLSISAAASRFLGTDFAMQFSEDSTSNIDMRADNFDFDAGGGAIVAPAAPSDADVVGVLSDNNALRSDEGPIGNRPQPQMFESVGPGYSPKVIAVNRTPWLAPPAKQQALPAAAGAATPQLMLPRLSNKLDGAVRSPEIKFSPPVEPTTLQAVVSPSPPALAAPQPTSDPLPLKSVAPKPLGGNIEGLQAAVSPVDRAGPSSTRLLSSRLSPQKPIPFLANPLRKDIPRVADYETLSVASTADSWLLDVGGSDDDDFDATNVAAAKKVAGTATPHLASRLVSVIDPRRVSTGLWAFLEAGLFNRFRRQNGNSWSLTGVTGNETSLFFFSNTTTLPGVGDEEDIEAVCLMGFPVYSAGSCLGPPYLYVSYHGGRTDGRARAVCKFSRDGCAMGVALMPSTLHRLQHPRGLLVHGNYLFAAESDRDNSAILRYSHCNPSLGNRRELLEVVVTGKEGDPDAGLVHPYGFAKDDNGWLYVSAQDTFVVLRYDAVTGEPAALPPALQHVVLNDTSIEELIAIEDEEALEARDEKRERIRQRVMRKYRLRLSGHAYENFYNGTFVDLGTDGVRGIAFDGQGLLYVADKVKGLLLFDRDGFSLGQLPVNVRNPISVHYCADRNSIWVGSADTMALTEYDTVTWEMTQSIMHRELVHPAGFVTHGDSLYVVSQRSMKLLRFSMITGELEAVVLERLPDAGERLILSPC